MPRPQNNASNPSLSPERQLREAVLLSFCDPLPEQCARLQGLSARQWQRLLHWLDVSGLALYFLDRMIELELPERLPAAVLSRLQQNLEDNTVRTDAMIAEAAAIHRDFQSAGLSYATVKGYSLWPISVPRLELRSQLDQDFLIAKTSATQARNILESRGYRLRAISGRSWEFKTNAVGVTSIRDLYKAKPQRTIELHLEAPGWPRDSVLARVEKRLFHDTCMPVLAPVDLFLGQGLHLFKHICRPFFRAAHLIEFRRHVRARHHDDLFWMELRQRAEQNSQAPCALGLVTLLISHVMGEFAPKALTCWTVDRLPAPVRLWVGIYGRDAVYCDSPGSKTYLLLVKELEGAGIPARRSLGRALLPRRLPPAIAHRAPGETARNSLQRHIKQLHFIWTRLRFHTLEGFRYLRESARWRKRTALVSSPDQQRCRREKV